jgi:hypothetical protein
VSTAARSMAQTTVIALKKGLESGHIGINWLEGFAHTVFHDIVQEIRQTDRLIFPNRE